MKKISLKTLQMISIIIWVISIIVFVLIYSNRKYEYFNKTYIILASWVAIFSILFVLITSKYKFGKIISLYSIFMMFFFLFNCGQCLLWAFGIFLETDILNTNLFKFDIPSSTNVFLTVLIAVVSILTVNLGVILTKISKNKKRKTIEFENKKSLNFFAILSIIVIPVTFYKIYLEYKISSSYGYRAIYYGDYNNISSYVEIISYLFFPCVMGLLLCSKYKLRKIVYAIFALFTIFNLAAGERGTWIYELCILIYLELLNRKEKVNYKKIFIIAILGYIGLFFISAIKELRNVGISLNSIMNTLKWDNNPIVEFIIEMGNSMKPTLVLVERGWNIYPYGNTYVFAFLAMISSKVISLLGLEYVSLSSWFSQTYLGIKYGAGFSIIAEAFINFGPYVLQIIMFVYGILLNKLLGENKENKKNKEDKYDLFKKVILLDAIINICRNIMYFVLKRVFWEVIVFLLLYRLVCGKEKKELEEVSTQNFK